ncbi:MAG: V-type ATP synthase subunit D [Candidatus Thermoplasmatota archaeon]|nr:V-type ATP synthase subunit D [Candidatus Thermoplasmatota archaeon]
MAGEIVEGVKPTRMELLSIRKKRILAEKGHKLLGEKRDALVVQFFEVLKKREKLKREVVETFRTANTSLQEAMARMGYDTVQALAHGISECDPPSMGSLNIMGVRVPVIDRKVEEEGPMPWGIACTPQSLDDSTRNYRNALDKVLMLAETEGSMERLAVEIEKTKRRVNALEHIFIPRLKNTERYITMQLQEREREDFFRRKRIKALMENREKNRPPERRK